MLDGDHFLAFSWRDLGMSQRTSVIIDGVVFEQKPRSSPLYLATRSLHGNVPRNKLDLMNTDHRPRDDLRWAEGLCGAVRGTAGCRWNYWTAVGRSDTLLYDYTQTENIKHFQ
jgi:hypothetical protein